MINGPEVSVVMSTYNRSGLLAGALDSLLCQQGGVSYEVVVVDNNSTDHTRELVESLIADGNSHLRYVFEPKQGVSYGRNCGINNSRAQIIAFTDDDVRVAKDWVASIKRAFDSFPEVDCIGGKVLPEWDTSPPRWLTREHWGPLGVQDYGDEAFYVSSQRPLCFVTGNIGFRRAALERIGGFAPELQRFKDEIGSMEDHDLMARFLRAGGRALYLPVLIASTEIPAERVTKAYHRKWHKGHGHFYAKMRADEMERSARNRLFDVPAHLYRQSLIDAACYFKCLLVGNRNRAFTHETRLRFFAGFFKTRRKDYLTITRRGSIREVVAFAMSVALNKNRG